MGISNTPLWYSSVIIQRIVLFASLKCLVYCFYHLCVSAIVSPLLGNFLAQPFLFVVFFYSVLNRYSGKSGKCVKSDNKRLDLEQGV
ncbi:hypothetical protein Hdeb2414_s0009g00321061 [Helianthus debilis subsp. tardiflorus]